MGPCGVGDVCFGCVGTMDWVRVGVCYTVLRVGGSEELEWWGVVIECVVLLGGM